jgi:hypothetical protein
LRWTAAASAATDPAGALVDEVRKIDVSNGDQRRANHERAPGNQDNKRIRVLKVRQLLE